MKKFLTIIAFISLTAGSLFAAVPAGSKVKSFSAADPDGKRISTESIRGFVTAGFYEGRYSSSKNNRLKEALKEFYNSEKKSGAGNLQSKVLKLSIVDGTPANFATRWVWKRKIKTKADENGVDIYIDWDGSVKKALNVSGDDSTFIIIDKTGTVTYIRSGVIPETEFPKIFSILKKLSR